MMARKEEATAVNMIGGSLFDMGHVSYVPIPALICSVSHSRLNRPRDSEQPPTLDRPRDGSLVLCIAQFGHVGNVPHDLFTEVRGTSALKVLLFP